jgi:hypothetical protein
MADDGGPVCRLDAGIRAGRLIERWLDRPKLPQDAQAVVDHVGRERGARRPDLLRGQPVLTRAGLREAEAQANALRVQPASSTKWLGLAGRGEPPGR